MARPPRQPAITDDERDAFAPPPRAPGGKIDSETAGYIAQMSGELSSLATNAGLDLLAYLLDMARTEAESLARSSEEESVT